MDGSCGGRRMPERKEPGTLGRVPGSLAFVPSWAVPGCAAWRKSCWGKAVQSRHCLPEFEGYPCRHPCRGPAPGRWAPPAPDWRQEPSSADFAETVGNSGVELSRQAPRAKTTARGPGSSHPAPSNDSSPHVGPEHLATTKGPWVQTEGCPDPRPLLWGVMPSACWGVVGCPPLSAGRR